MYPWEEWFALSEFTLVEGEHFRCKPIGMAQQVRDNATIRKLSTRVRLSLNEMGMTRIKVVVWRRR